MLGDGLLDLPGVEVDGPGDEGVGLVVVERHLGPARCVRPVQLVGIRLGEIDADALRTAVALDVLAGGAQLRARRELRRAFHLVVGQRVVARAPVTLLRGLFDDARRHRAGPLSLPLSGLLGGPATVVRSRFVGPGRPRQGDADHHGGSGHRDGRTGHHLAQMAVHYLAHIFPLLPVRPREYVLAPLVRHTSYALVDR
ncbi:hypothetical protein STVIR_1571 [Streptomyces viridochromogenes Tue57]|uniref:Uncharacterized protein n=1 Tax=Streptomyces viridochromogenes Tue57 TaxID=1160705 RepID=L8PIQ7_STRVR|nr:hypothetical protein STVIR_1571 [Streptomyces viridochromogenes Tue57]